MNRRALFNTTAIVAVAATLDACASGSATSTTAVEQVITDIQGVLSYVGPIIPLISVFVPGTTAFVPLVEAGLGVATGLLNTLSSTMTTASAQPIVHQIATALGGALDAADHAVVLISSPTQRAGATALIAEARVVLGMLDTFVTGVVATVVPAAKLGSIRHVHLRTVR